MEWDNTQVDNEFNTNLSTKFNQNYLGIIAKYRMATNEIVQNEKAQYIIASLRTAGYYLQITRPCIDKRIINEDIIFYYLTEKLLRLAMQCI